MVKCLIATMLGALLACSSSSDSCARGYRAVRKEDRCVPEVAMGNAPASSGTPESEGPISEEVDGTVSSMDFERSGAESPMSDQDAGEEPPFEMDAAAHPTQTDGGTDAVDAASEPADAQDRLADAVSADAEPADAPGGPTEASSVRPCSEQDVMRWEVRHRSEGLRALITGCGISCDSGVACADECARSASGMVACNECTRTEVACMARWCLDACGPASTESGCLTCICGADCVATFEQCSGHTLAVCAESELGVRDDAGTRPAPSPGLLFARSATGLATSALVDRTSCEVTSDRHIGFLPAGPRRFLSVSMPEAEVVFVYSASCAAPPCQTQAYTLSDAGTFDARVYEARWDVNFSDMEIFSLGGVRYLVRVRGDGEMPDREVVDDLLIDRLEWES